MENESVGEVILPISELIDLFSEGIFSQTHSNFRRKISCKKLQQKNDSSISITLGLLQSDPNASTRFIDYSSSIKTPAVLSKENDSSITLGLLQSDHIDSTKIFENDDSSSIKNPAVLSKQNAQFLNVLELFSANYACPISIEIGFKKVTKNPAVSLKANDLSLILVLKSDHIDSTKIFENDDSSSIKNPAVLSKQNAQFLNVLELFSANYACPISIEIGFKKVTKNPAVSLKANDLSLILVLKSDHIDSTKIFENDDSSSIKNPAVLSKQNAQFLNVLELFSAYYACPISFEIGFKKLTKNPNVSLKANDLSLILVLKSDLNASTRFIEKDNSSSIKTPAVLSKENDSSITLGLQSEPSSQRFSRELFLDPVELSLMMGAQLNSPEEDRTYSLGAIENGLPLSIQNPDVSSKITLPVMDVIPPPPEALRVSPSGMLPVVKNPTGEKIGTASGNVIGKRGGVVDKDGVKLVFPAKAVNRPLHINITSENPSRYYGLIIEKDLQNDVNFCAPMINLHPNGHFFEKPVTLTFYLNVKDFRCDNVVILHGKEALDGKIHWEDITGTSEIDTRNAKVTTEIKGFSLITALLRRTLIRTKDIVARLNIMAFNYAMAALLNVNSNELALLFVSRDVYSEEFYRESETSALVKLKTEGYRELLVRSLDEHEERRIYNRENLKISVRLGEDYKLADSHDNHSFAVDSSVWWNTGHAIKLSLEGTKDVRILCGKISVEGENGHSSERYFCDLGLHGYVKSLLGVEGAIFNVIPFSQALGLPAEAMDQAITSCYNDDQQLDVILNHWPEEKDKPENLAALRKTLESIKQEKDHHHMLSCAASYYNYILLLDCRVNQRGQMHIKHLRYFAAKISSLEHDNADFSTKVHTLCNMVLTDCCIELEKSADGVERAASFTNHVVYLEMHGLVSEHVSKYCQQISESSSAESINEPFLVIVPDLIQSIKEIFVIKKNSKAQNGLRGLPDKTVDNYVSKLRAAEKDNDVSKLICVVSGVLEQLCRENCVSQPTAEKIEMWGKSLAILSMLEYLKPFFQNCLQHVTLHKRLQLLSGNMKGIVSNPLQFADEVLMRDLANVSMSLIHFAKFDPSNLVRFELTDSVGSLADCKRANLEYDGHQNTFSQEFHIKKDSEDEFQLHAVAYVHIDGQIHKVGATQREALSELLFVLNRDLSEDVLDPTQSEVTQCHLTLRTLPVAGEDVVSLRLVYKWESEAIVVDSKDFEALTDSSVQGARMPEVQLAGPITLLVPSSSIKSRSTGFRDHRGSVNTLGFEPRRTNKRDSPFPPSQEDPKRRKLVKVKEGKPTVEELQDIAVEMGKDWVKLGRRLEFDEAKLASFDKENDELSEKVYAMLTAWKRRKASGATYQVLYEALCNSYVGRKDLAENVCYHSG